MFRTSTLLILLCLHQAVGEGRYNSKRARFIAARHENPPIQRLMIISNEGYKISDQHRNRVWDLYRTKMGTMNLADETQAEGEVSNSRITSADGRRGLQVDIGGDPSSRLGLASIVSGNSFVWTPVMTPRKASSADDPSINDQAVGEGRYNSKRTRFIAARHENPPLQRLMIISNEGYKISDQHRNQVWDLYRTKMGTMNLYDETQAEGEVSNSRITSADGRRGLQVDIGGDPSSRLGLASPLSRNSFVGTPVMTPRKASSADDPSINEIDSADYFPTDKASTSTTTEKPNIVWGNDNGIVTGPHN